MGWFVVFLLIIVGCLILFYFRSEYEKEQLIVKEYQLVTSKVQKARTFVFLSDLHEHDFGNGNQRLLEKIEQVNPDAVLVGGDLVVCKKQIQTDVSERICRDLSKRFPVFYANGNHEERMRGDFDVEYPWVSTTYERYVHALRDSGVKYLSNDSVKFQDIWIHGLNIEHRFYKKFSFPEMEKEYIVSSIGEQKDEGAFHILLAHSPMFTKAYAEWGADLALSGHFHGGTVRLLDRIGLMTPQFQFFSKKVAGMIEYKRMKHIISAGLGTHSINIRINNKPELIVLRVLPA